MEVIRNNNLQLELQLREVERERLAYKREELKLMRTFVDKNGVVYSRIIKTN